MSDSATTTALVQFARAKGVRVRRVTEGTFDKLRDAQELEEAPFAPDVGINWQAKQLFYVRTDQWPEMIHELGHLIASSVPPKHAVEWGVLWLGDRSRLPLARVLRSLDVEQSRLRC